MSLSPSHRLLVGLSLSSFSDRLWDFGFPVLLAQADPENALFVAALVLIISQSSSFVLAAPLGALLEYAGENKFNVVRWAVLVQNGATVVLSAALMVTHKGNWVFWGMTALFACLSTLASTAERVTVTQEWVPNLLAEKSEVERAGYNAHIRQVYLLAKIVAPLVAGAAFSVLSFEGSLLFICGWNVVSCVMELAFMRSVWSEMASNAAPAAKKGGAPSSSSSSSSAASLAMVWQFCSHPMFPFMLSYALLYCTVLCPGSLLHLHLLTSYGVSQTALAWFQAASSCCGVIGTFLLVRFMAASQWGVVTSAGVFLCFQIVCLWVGCVSLWVLDVPGVFLALLAVSRVGLWGFDVAHLQIMQMGLQDSPHRLVISTLQFGICDLFSLIVAVPALALNSHVAVRGLMMSSLACVTLSFSLYTVWAWKRQRAKDKSQ